MDRTVRWIGVGLVFVLCLGVAAAQAQQRPVSDDESSRKGRGIVTAVPESPSRSLQAPGELVPTLAVPRLIKFAGTLKDAQGKPLSNTVGLTFAIYKDQEGDAPLWLETQNAQLDEQGHYSVLLGATKSEGLPLELFRSGEPRWLGVQVQLPGEVEAPRVLLVSVPYALKAADADTVGGIPASAFVLAAPSDTTSGTGVSGSTTPANGNSKTTSGAGVLGSTTQTSGNSKTEGKMTPSGTGNGAARLVPIAPEQHADQSLEKARMAESIIAREEEASGRPFDAAFRDRIRGDLATRSLAELEGVQKRASGLLPIPNAPGASQADLVYTPITPCRIVDTRIAGGPIAAGFTRNFLVTGGNLSLQGGSGTGCGVPFGPATAAVVNFVAVAPAGAGDLRQTPFGTPVPLASFLNYVNSGIPNDNTANASVMTICDPATTTCTFDFTIQVDGSATNLVADVQGFYRRFDGSVLTRAISAEPFVNATTSPVTNNLLTGVVAPTAGGLLVNISFSCASFTAGTTNTEWFVTPTVDTTNHSAMVLFFPHASVSQPLGDSASATFFQPVAAGTHTVSYTATRSSGDGSLDCNLFASSLFVPFSNTGGTP